jgi:hypothetical protein
VDVRDVAANVDRAENRRVADGERIVGVRRSRARKRGHDDGDEHE